MSKAYNFCNNCGKTGHAFSSVQTPNYKYRHYRIPSLSGRTAIPDDKEERHAGVCRFHEGQV